MCYGTSAAIRQQKSLLHSGALVKLNGVETQCNTPKDELTKNDHGTHPCKFFARFFSQVSWMANAIQDSTEVLRLEAPSPHGIRIASESASFVTQKEIAA